MDDESSDVAYDVAFQDAVADLVMIRALLLDNRPLEAVSVVDDAVDRHKDTVPDYTKTLEDGDLDRDDDGETVVGSFTTTVETYDDGLEATADSVELPIPDDVKAEAGLKVGDTVTVEVSADE